MTQLAQARFDAKRWRIACETSTYGLDPSGGLDDDADERASVLKCEVWKLDERVTSRRVYVTLTHLHEQNERTSGLSVQRPVRLVL